MAHIVAGTGVAQLISFLVLPVLSRIYAPEAFGGLSIVVAIVGLAASLAAMRLESVVMVVRGRTALTATIQLAVLSSLIVSSIAALVVQLLVQAAPDSALTAIPFVSLWVGLHIFLASTFSTLSQVALRDGGFGLVARRTVVVATGTAGGQLAGAAVVTEAVGLLGGLALGRFLGIVSMRAYLSALAQPFRTRNLFAVLKRYWRYPAIFAPAALLNMLGLQFPILVVAAWFSVGDAGQLGMADRLIAVPLALLGNAVGQVFESDVAAIIRSRTTNSGVVLSYLRVSLLLVVIGIVLALPLLVFGPWLATTFLGESWEPAGYMLQAMAFTMLARLVANPTTRVLALLQRSTITLALDVARVILMIVAALLMIVLKLDVIQSIWVLYSSLTVSYLASWACGLIVVRKESTKYGSSP